MPAQPSEATIESLEWVQTLAVKRTRLPLSDEDRAVSPIDMANKLRVVMRSRCGARLHAGSPGMPTPDALSMGLAFIRPCYGETPCHATARPHLFAPLQQVAEQHGHGGDDAHSRHITH